MAKSDKTDLLTKWQRSEAKYRDLADRALAGEPIDLDFVLALVGARAKADKRMDDYLKDALGEAALVR